MKLEWNEMVQRLTNKEEAMKEARQHERRQEERIIERLKAERDEAEVKLKAATKRQVASPRAGCGTEAGIRSPDTIRKQPQPSPQMLPARRLKLGERGG